MTDATFANPGSVVIDTDTIRTIGILHFTIGVHDHIADAKFIQKCSAVGTWARTSAIPSCNVAAATSCWRRSATPYCRATHRGDHLLGALKVVVGGEDCVGHSITRARAQRHEADQIARQRRGREDIVLRERR